MVAQIEFFPVDNGDMTLITLNNGKKILIDINIRNDATDDSKDMPNVAKMLTDRLSTDSKGRPYVDAFLLSHPDQDHCRGLINHFHLGAPGSYKEKDDKIVIREMWSSPIVFRRQNEVDLCDDAKAWWAEARRRVNLYKKEDNKSRISDGDLIQILGEDKDGKTDGLEDILVKTDTPVMKICGIDDGNFSAWLLAPLLVNEEEAEKLEGKNNSSTVLRFDIDVDDQGSVVQFLTGGDAEVDNWERIWQRNSSQKDRLEYDILQSPHHCSWHSLSHDSWSKYGEKANVSEDARSALGQAKEGAYIVSSSKEIKDDENDPPCIRAKREYESILNDVNGKFLCTADECNDDVLLFTLESDGPKPGNKQSTKKSQLSSPKPRMTEKRNGGHYA